LEGVGNHFAAGEEMKIIGGLISVIAGLAIWGVAISVLVTWLAFCFGSVVIGVLLLIFAPHILLAPLAIGVPGTGLIALGMATIGGAKI
jgi:hypothetical protein